MRFRKARRFEARGRRAASEYSSIRREGDRSEVAVIRTTFNHDVRESADTFAYIRAEEISPPSLPPSLPSARRLFTRD